VYLDGLDTGKPKIKQVDFDTDQMKREIERLKTEIESHWNRLDKEVKRLFAIFEKLQANV